MKNTILFYITISKSYFIIYSILFYNIQNISNSIFFFATLFKYSFLFFFYYFSYFSSSSLPPLPLSNWQPQHHHHRHSYPSKPPATSHRPTTTTTTTIVHANYQNPYTQPPTQKPIQQLADLETQKSTLISTIRNPQECIDRSRNPETQLISTVKNLQERIDLHCLKPTRTHRSPPTETHGPPHRSTTILAPDPLKSDQQSSALDRDDLAQKRLSAVPSERKGHRQ